MPRTSRCAAWEMKKKKKKVNAVWRTSIPYNELNINTKFSLMFAERSTFAFLFTSVALEGKKKFKPPIKIYEYGYSPVHTGFQTLLSIFHIKILCELESDLRLNSCWYMHNRLVASDHYMKLDILVVCMGFFGFDLVFVSPWWDVLVFFFSSVFYFILAKEIYNFPQQCSLK